ncbi:respiratory nitrate reductase subunit gamma [Schinkia sp. CFF1]
MQQFLWVIFPYLMVTIFLVGHFYRYHSDQLAWTAKSSEFLEKKSLRWGSMMFHVGILMVFAGHVVGLLIPKFVMEKLGLSESLYHAGAVYGGGVAGLITLIGILLLLNRRVTNKRVRDTSDPSDFVTVIVLALIVVIGIYNTAIGNQLHPHFDYRETISPWFRGLVMFTPDPYLMSEVPLGFQLHVLISFALIGIWPFTRLVHVWSVPLNYFKRSYILYRRRAS